MDWNREQIKQRLTVVCGGVLFYCVLQKLTAVLGVLMWLLGILGPFLVGGAIAFVLNVPMTAIERHLPARKKARRPLSLLLTLAAMIGVLTLAFCVIGPGIGEAVGSIGHQIPAAVQRLQTQLEKLEALLPQLETLADNFQLDIDWNALSRRAMAMAQDFGSRLLSSGGGLIGGVVSGVSIFVIGLIFSFYVLLQKEKLARQGRQVCYALLPERWADKTLELTFRPVPGGRDFGYAVRRGYDAVPNALRAFSGRADFPDGVDSRSGSLHRLCGGRAADRRHGPLAGIVVYRTFYCDSAD